MATRMRGGDKEFTAVIMILAMEHRIHVTVHLTAMSEDHAKKRIDDTPMPFHGEVSLVALFNGERENLCTAVATIRLS